MSSRVAACHVHSEWSYDAEWTLKDLAAEFQSRGCEIVLMTEHDRGWDESKWQEYVGACCEASGEEILMVPGIEYSDPGNDVHVLVWGAEMFLGEGLETSDLLDRIQDTGSSAVFAHPERKRAWEIFKPEWFERMLGIEVWNRKTDGWAPSLRGIEAWRSHGVLPFASLDFHRRNQFFPLHMKLEIAEECDKTSVFSALKARRALPLFKGQPLIPELERGGPAGARSLERLRRVLRRVIPH